ncbi:hypothetical protein HYH03_019211 [Edaphochlamys debaryana]|uniref:Uncharacterized protein n=1 Tax=Edaphochlamys debaryana TaxID=47281 RepID=A0A835XF43_9CHLO|nr:hypothetical protein HYH03_019211 [Edaphochlamys debaryana]|eukprot:KAG2481822.1 hypothetical protein HYH03_019211 [Edaphochlamys debaryana]
MAPPSDPVADVWQSPELLGHVAVFLGPSQTAWNLIRVNKAAGAAFDSNGQPVPRTVSLSAAFKSGLLAFPEARLQARVMCRRLTRRQRVELLCRCVAADCSREGLEGAVVAAGLSPPPLEVLIAAASAGRLATCRWLVEVLGCPGLVRLACLCLISAAGPGPAVGREARAWLAPAAAEGWSEEQEAKAASGDLGAVDGILWGWEPEDANMEPAALGSCHFRAAAACGHVEAVRHLLSRGVRPDGPWLGSRGGVGMLQALHEAGCMADPALCFSLAVEEGALPVVEWLLETYGAAALRLRGSIAIAAARSGSEHYRAFRDAASHGDLHMMQCLRKLGCPYSDEAAEALAQAASRVPASASALPWLEAPLSAAVWKAEAAEAAAARAEAEAAYAEAMARTEAGVETAVCFMEHVVSLSYMVVDVGLCLAGCWSTTAWRCPLTSCPSWVRPGAA